MIVMKRTVTVLTFAMGLRATREEFLVWLGLLGILLLSLVGCSALHPGMHTPEVRTFTVAEAPDVAFTKSLRALQTIGASVGQQDRLARTCTSDVHNAVTLSVAVYDSGQGTTVVARGQVKPNKLVLGRFTEVDEFVEAYRAQP